MRLEVALMQDGKPMDKPEIAGLISSYLKRGFRVTQRPGKLIVHQPNRPTSAGWVERMLAEPK